MEDIVAWDQVPRWRKEEKDGARKKIGERNKRNKGLGATLSSTIPARLALAPLLQTLRFEDENDYKD